MSTKIIYINGRFLSQRITGVQRFAMNLVMALDNELNSNLALNVQIVLVTPSSMITDLNLKKIEQRKIGKLSGHLWEQIELPFHTRNSLLINFCNVGPAFKKNQLVTICDAAVFRYSKAYKLLFIISYRLLAYLNCFFSKGIITISEFSKNELIHFVGVNKEKISIIYPAVKFSTSGFDDNIFEKLKLKKQGYFLAVGSIDFRKNFAGIINAFLQLDSAEIELVIVGGGYSKVFTDQKIPNNKRIKLAGYLNDEELISLYKSALAFVYPSFYEGFGIPPLESMSMGCPVIVSETASLPEVCGEAALYCDPNKVESIKGAMYRLLNDKELRNDLIVKGYQRIIKFSYADSAKKLLSLIQI